MEVRIGEIIRLSDNYISLRLVPGLNAIYPYLPGNKASVKRNEKVVLEGWIMSDPYMDDHILLTGKKLSRVEFKQGEKLTLDPASGNFILRPLSDYRRHFLFFAEEDGILPVMAMIQSLLKVEQRSRIRLIWIGPSELEFFRNQLGQLEAMVHGRLEVTLPEHRGELGNWLNSLFGVPAEIPHRVYISGSDGFITLLINRLTQAGIPSSSMHLNYM